MLKGIQFRFKGPIVQTPYESNQPHVNSADSELSYNNVNYPFIGVTLHLLWWDHWHEEGAAFKYQPRLRDPGTETNSVCVLKLEKPILLRLMEFQCWICSRLFRVLTSILISGFIHLERESELNRDKEQL